MKISIIVPVYNSEKYLIECIESILSQSHRNIELLLVDDESQDTSPEICDMYQTNDERVKVVHKKNWRNGRSEKCRLANGNRRLCNVCR